LAEDDEDIITIWATNGETRLTQLQLKCIRAEVTGDLSKERADKLLLPPVGCCLQSGQKGSSFSR
jgi:hypothetical protein